jgi:hypothetical protein
MGYFRPRISRQRCAAQVEAAVRRQSRADLSVWRPAPRDPPAPRAAIYLRFAVGRKDPASQQALGVFQAAYEVRNRHGKRSQVGRSFDAPLTWFGENLHAPDVSERAIFWFKSDAAECLRQVWQIIHALRAAGEAVWMMRCRHPGMIRYEDAYQVAAVPDEPRRWRRRPVGR